MKKGIFKKIAVLLVLTVFAASSVFAGGSSEKATSESGPVTVRIATWTSNEDQLALLTSFVDEFAAQKGIEITPVFESIPYAEYNTKLSLELQGNAAPDIYWVLETAAPAFIESGLLAPLNDALAAYDVDDFSEPAMELWKKGDTIYAVPFSTSPFFILYNEDLFTAAGAKTPKQLYEEGNWTWDTFREVSKQIKDNTGVWAYQTVDGQGYDARVLQNLISIIRSYGGDAWTDDGEILINAPESVAAVQLFHDMVYVDGSVVPPGDQSDFFAGAAAMTVGQVSRVSKLVESGFNWGIAPMPAGPEGDVPVIGQAAIGVNSKGKQVELASELAAYMTCESAVARMAGIWPPARKSVLESEEFLSSNAQIAPEDMQMAVATSIKTGRVLPSHQLYPQIEVESKISFDKLWNANADVQKVLDEVAAVYAKYIK